MKILVGVFSGLGIASLVAGGALWIQSRTIVQWSGATFGYLQDCQKRVEVDVSQRFKVGPDIILPNALTHLEGTTRHRCADLHAYAEAFCGFALMWSMLAVVAWRRQKLPDIERETAELAVSSRCDVRGRQTTKESASADVL